MTAESGSTNYSVFTVKERDGKAICAIEEREGWRNVRQVGRRLTKALCRENESSSTARTS